MSERKLTPEEIDLLYDYLDEIGIFYFEVQMELVDHLCVSIEEELNKNSELNFLDAFNLVCENFGGKSGFRLIRDQKQEEIKKKYEQQVNRYIWDLFKIPNGLLFLCLIITLYLSLNIPVFYKTLPTLGMVGVIFLIALSYLKNNLKLIEAKDFILKNHIRKSFRGSLVLLYFTPLFLKWILNIERLPNLLSFINLHLLSSILIVLYLAMVYANVYYLPRCIKKDFCNQFPQFVKS